MRKLTISKGDSRYGDVKVGEVSWPALVKKFTTFAVTDETFSEYKESDNKLAIKDVGWIVGGPFKPAKRRKDLLQYRSILAVDLDHLDPWDVETVVETYAGLNLEFVVHSSHSHSADAPRLRLVMPFERDVTVEEYEPIARMVASWFAMDPFDDTGFQVSRVMFWPSVATDGDTFVHQNKGQWLDPDAVLNQYKDWKDWGEWPTSSREDISRDPSVKAENPYTKPGAIGAFNRAFEIPHAIHHFELPYTPSGMGDDRYTLVGGTSVDGAIYYPDDGHLYSWHESDPARGNVNAWDLVRIHKFGHLDTNPDIPIGRRESQKQMQACALLEPAVALELAGESGFDDLTQGDDNGEIGGDDDNRKPKKSRLTNKAIRERIDNRTEPLDEDSRRKVIVDIAAAKLLPTEISVLAAVIKAAHVDPAPTKQMILDEIKVTAKQLTSQVATDGQISDIELDLLQYCLDEWFEGGDHIKRFGRQFWCYEHGVWLKREDEFIRGCMQETFIKLRTERPNDSINLVAAMAEMATSSATSSLWAMFAAHVNRRDTSLDPMHLMDLHVPAVINCLNGELHFERDGTWEFTDHHPELFLTSQIPVKWEPKADTSEWDKFCDIIFHDSFESDEMRRHLEEAGGYILQPSRKLASFFMMKGAPLAGKSTFGALMGLLLGSSSANKQLKSYSGANSHDTAGLVGKILLLDEDFNKGDLLPDGFIKRISEAKRMTANPKGKDEYEFVCRAVPMVICNAWPATRDYSGALDRRLLAWELSAIPIEMQNDEARDRLLSAGMTGVFRRFVEGFARLHKRGGWSLPSECVDAAGCWTRNTDVVKVWASDCIADQTSGWISRGDTYGWFTQWYRDNNPGHHPVGKKEFLLRIGGILGAPRKRNGEFGWADFRYLGTEFGD